MILLIFDRRVKVYFCNFSVRMFVVYALIEIELLVGLCEYDRRYFFMIFQLYLTQIYKSKAHDFTHTLGKKKHFSAVHHLSRHNRYLRKTFDFKWF